MVEGSLVSNDKDLDSLVADLKSLEEDIESLNYSSTCVENSIGYLESKNKLLGIELDIANIKLGMYEKRLAIVEDTLESLFRVLGMLSIGVLLTSLICCLL